METFKSNNHPGDLPAAAVYAQAIALPFGVCCIPVMVGGLAAVLLEQPLFPELAFGFAGAFVVSWAWTHFMLSRRIAEIRVREDAAAVQTVRDALQGNSPMWKRVFQVRRRGEGAEASIGRDSYALLPSEWRTYDRLVTALEEAIFSPHSVPTNNG